MQVRAKLRVSEVTDVGTWNYYEDGEAKPCPAKRIRLTAVTASEIPEDIHFNRATPSAQLEMVVLNPNAAEFFQVGDEFYADFTRASS